MPISLPELRLTSLLDPRPAALVEARWPAPPVAPPAYPDAPTPAGVTAALSGAPPAGAVRPSSADPEAIARQLHAAVQRPGVVSSDPAANDRWIEDHASFRYSDPTTHERAVRGALDFVTAASPKDLAALSPDGRDILETALTQGLIDADHAPWASDLRPQIAAATEKLRQGQEPASPARSSTEMGLDSIGANLDALGAEIQKAGTPAADASMLSRARQLLDQARAATTPGQDQPMPSAGNEAAALMRSLIERYPAPWSQPVR